MSNQKSSVIGKAKLFNSTNKNAFDLSKRVVFSHSLGTISPVSCTEVFPGEKVSLNSSFFTRAQTLVSNSYGRFVETQQAFYVPYSSLLRSYSMRALPTSQKSASDYNENRYTYQRSQNKPLSNDLPSIANSYLLWLYLPLLVLEYAIPNAGLNNKVPAAINFRPYHRNGMLRSVAIARHLQYLGFDDVLGILKTNKIQEPANVNPKGDALDYVADRFNGIAVKGYINFGSTGSKVVEMVTHTKERILEIYDKLYNNANLYGTYVSPMRLYAYQKIYNDFFRNDTWQAYDAASCNLDWLEIANDKLILTTPVKLPTRDVFEKLLNYDWSATDTSWVKFNQLFVNAFKDEHTTDMFTWTDFIEDDTTVVDPRICNLPLDSVNGVLPSPQYGDSALAKVTSTLSGDYAIGASGYINAYVRGEKLAPVDDGNRNVQFYAGQNPATDVAINSGVSVKDIRTAQSLQKFKEISLSHDNYFIDQIKAHFGVAPKFDPFKTYFIGGTSTAIQVDTQVNQNLADDNNATLGGIASAQGSYNANYMSDDYGLVIVVHSSYPILDYTTQGLPNQLLATQGTDLPIPEFDNNGFEPRFAINALGLNADSYAANKKLSVYGYASRYFDYKTSRDIVLGDIGVTQKDKVLATDNLMDSSVDIIQRTLYATPDLADALFANNQHMLITDEQFYTNMNLQIGVVRPFSVHSLPFAN